MAPFEACKSTGRIPAMPESTITLIDSYLVGVVLDEGKGDATLLVTDGNDAELLYLTIVAAVEGSSKAVMLPVPVLASNGIKAILTGHADTRCIIYYAEQYFSGHRHV